MYDAAAKLKVRHCQPSTSLAVNPFQARWRDGKRSSTRPYFPLGLTKSIPVKRQRVFKTKSEALQTELDAALRPFQVSRPTRRRSDLATDNDDVGSEAGPSSLASKKIKLTELPGSNRFWAYVPVSDEDQVSRCWTPPLASRCPQLARTR